MDETSSRLPTSPSLFESRHSCYYCQRIIINPSVPRIIHKWRQTNEAIINSFEFSAIEIARATKAKCPLFQGFTRIEDWSEIATKTINKVQLDYEQSLARTVIIDFKFYESLCGATTVPPDIEKVLVSWRWADEKILPCEGMSLFYDGCCIYADADLDNPAANYVTARPFYPYIFQDTMFQRIEEWLKHCGTHIECAQAMERSLELNRGRGPARLLYVNSSNTSSIRLVERKMNMEYIALSYCWGGDDSMKLTNLEFDSWAQSIPVINLPKTIRDAIICTRRLRLDYLWVDRLCIIQDNAADVTQQIAVMPEIYGMAYLTLSASSAVTSQDGFLQSRDEVSSKFSRSRISLLYICPDGSTGSITLAPSQELSDSLTPGTLAVDRRAWTMQEQRLSRRLLQFCSYHLLWKCHSTERVHQHSELSCRTADRAMTDGERSLPVDLVDGENGWENIVKDYSDRAMSDPRDKLVAISAVAQDTARRLSSQRPSKKEKPRYLAGLWEHQLPYALCWLRLYGDLRPRPSAYRAPSWSWAAVDGFIFEYPSKMREGQSIKIEILDCVVTPASETAPFGAVLSAYVRVIGRMREESWDQKENSLVGEEGKSILPMTAWGDAVEDESRLEIASNAMVRVWCLEVGFNGPNSYSDNEMRERRGPFGLLLVKAGKMDKSVDGETVFRRVGIFYMFHEGDMSFQDCEYREMTII